MSQKLWPFEFALCFHVQFRASRYIMHLNWHPSVKLWPFEYLESFSIYYAPELTSEAKVVAVWICLAHWCLISSEKLWPYEFADSFWCSISRVSVYYWPGLDIRVKSCGRLNLPLASMFNFGHLNILFAWNGHPTKRFLPFDFLERFRCSISSVSIYYWSESDIRVKSCGWLNLPCALMFNFKYVDILCAWIRHLCENLGPYEFPESFRCSISRVSIYYWPGSDIQVKVVAVWIFLLLPCLISSISIYHAPESDIRVKSYGPLNLPCASMFNFGHLDILCAWIGHPTESFWLFDFHESFRCSISKVSIYYWPASDIRVKSNGRFNLPCASMLNFGHLDILFAWIGHPTKRFWLFDFHASFRCSISSVSTCYWSELDIRVKSCGYLNLPCALMFNFKHVDILCAWIRHLSNKLWPYELAESFRCSISRVSIYYWPGSDIRVKSCGHLNFSLASMFNFEHLDISCAWIGLPSQKLWPFELALFFHV